MLEPTDFSGLPTPLRWIEGLPAGGPPQPAACTDQRGLLSAAIDGELTPTERATLDEHLRSCPSCRVALAMERETKALIQRRAPRVSAPPELVDAIRRLTRPESRPDT